MTFLLTPIDYKSVNFLRDSELFISDYPLPRSGPGDSFIISGPESGNVSNNTPINSQAGPEMERRSGSLDACRYVIN